MFLVQPTRMVHVLLVNWQILYFYQRKWDNSPGISLPQGESNKGSFACPLVILLNELATTPGPLN